MVIAIAKQATTLESLSLHCSGIGGDGEDLCASLSETNITSLTNLRLYDNEGFFSTEDRCTLWGAIIKKQTGMIYCEMPEETESDALFTIIDELPSLIRSNGGAD